MNGLQRLKRPEDIADLRDREVTDIALTPMLKAMAQADQAMAAKRAQSSGEDSDGS